MAGLIDKDAELARLSKAIEKLEKDVQKTQGKLSNDKFVGKAPEAVIQKAQSIVSVFEKANTGLVVIDGKLIEKPVLREMYRILSIAEKIKKNKL